jgi:hypothetical protein
MEYPQITLEATRLIYRFYEIEQSLIELRNDLLNNAPIILSMEQDARLIELDKTLDEVNELYGLITLKYGYNQLNSILDKLDSKIA